MLVASVASMLINLRPSYRQSSQYFPYLLSSAVFRNYGKRDFYETTLPSAYAHFFCMNGLMPMSALWKIDTSEFEDVETTEITERKNNYGRKPENSGLEASAFELV
jgi:hypothetical protein